MFEALRRTDPVSTGAVFTFTPIMSAVFGWLLMRQITTPEMALSLALAGIGAAVASAGLISAGLGTRATLPEPTGGEANPALVDEVRAKARRANALGYLGQGAGVTAVGLIVTSRLAF